MDEAPDEEKPSFLTRMFGKDPLKTPCFRETFLYSISSYFGVGLLTFLFTSKPQLSSHVGMGSFVTVTLGYFSYCRYKFDHHQIDTKELQEMLHKAAVMQGTEEDVLKEA